MRTPVSAADRLLLANRLAADRAARWVGPPAQLTELPDETFSPGVYRTTWVLGECDGFVRLETMAGLGALVVWVRPYRRRRGLASQAVTELVEHADELHVLVLEAVVAPANRAALAFFAALGFAARGETDDGITLQRCVGQLAPLPPAA